MNEVYNSKQCAAIANRVSIVTIVVNLVLSLFKLFAGILGHSAALISDAIHSASDIVSTFVVMIGTKLAAKEPDQEHEYGHERLECVAAILLSVILFFTGVSIGYQALQAIVTAQYSPLLAPGIIALIAAITSILVKEWMYHYTRAAAKKIRSTALMADAWHHRSDALSSIGSLVGVIGARLGYPMCDSLASLVICLFILKAAIDIFRSAVEQMTDHSCQPELREQIRATALSTKGVLSVDLLRTRQFGSRVYVELELASDGSLSLNEAHAIAQAVHDTLESRYPEIKHCMVHMNPYQPTERP